MWIFLAAVAGGAISLTGVFLGNHYLSKAQDRRWEAEQRGLYARETAQRIRDLYGRMAQSAATLQEITHECSFVTTSDGTVEKRDERHAASLTEAQKVIAQVGGQLLVEPAARSVREKYTELRKIFDKYLITDNNEPPGVERTKKIRALEQEIGRLSLQVQSLSENHLELLDTPPTLAAIPARLWSRQLKPH